MRKISLLIAIVVLLAGVSVNAQKPRSGKKGNPPIIQYPDILVEDEGGAGYIVFNPSSGAYRCVMCKYEGYTFESVGQVKIDGCNIYLTDLKEVYRTQISVNICSQEAKSAVEIYKPSEGIYGNMPVPVLEYWKDTNLLNNKGVCSYQSPPKYSPLPPEPEGSEDLIIQNDADGSFLLIDRASGAYKFIHCEDGMALSGTGRVRIDGCNLYFEDLQTDRRVLASANVCEMEGKAAIEHFGFAKKAKTGAPTMQEFITDINLRDNTTLCGPKK